MSGRRSAALPAAISGAAVLLAAAAWFLRGEAPGAAPPPAEPPAPLPAPATEAPAAPGPVAAVRVAPSSPALPEGTPPYAVLRLVDAETRDRVRWSPHAAVYIDLTVDLTRYLMPELVKTGPEGQVQVFAFPKQEEVFGRGRALYLLAVPGYRAVEFASRKELEGEREIALRPTPVSVRGVLSPGRGVTGATVWCQILPADPHAAPVQFSPPAPVPPSAFGPFAIHDLPAGKWRLTARAILEAGAIATREFETGESPADLGEIVLRKPVTLLARVVAKDGAAVLDPGLRVERGAERPEGKAEEDGWIRFSGLEAGTEVRVVSGLPDLEQEVRLPPDGGEEVRVELRWEEEGVRCRLRFTVDGVPPSRWGEIFEGPTLDKGAWKKDGFLEHEMAPGEYLFGIWAEPAGKAGMKRVWAKLTVPRQPAWETDVSCAEEPPK